MTEHVRRRAARIVVVDAADRILLLQYARPNGETFWATPGGGLEPDESFEAAAIREAAEELGVVGVNLTRLWEANVAFEAAGRTISQHEQFFLLRFDGTVVAAEVEEAHRAEGILQTRWWTVSELRTTDDLIFPEDLASRVTDVVEARRVR